MIESPLILQVRQDEAAGVIRAFATLAGDDGFSAEIGTLSLTVAKADPDHKTFDEWVEFLKRYIVRFTNTAIAGSGATATVIGTIRRKPPEAK